MSAFQFEFQSDLFGPLPRRQLAVGEVLFTQGDPSHSIYRVEKGCVRLVVFPEDGKQLILFRARDGEVFAEDHLSRDTYGFTAIADLPSVVQVVSKERALQETMSDWKKAGAFITCLSDRYHQLLANYERLGITSAKARLLHWLNSSSSGRAVDMTGRLKSLAGDLNLTHETIYRALKTLERDGLIRREQGRISIVHPIVAPLEGR